MEKFGGDVNDGIRQYALASAAQYLCALTNQSHGFVGLHRATAGATRYTFNIFMRKDVDLDGICAYYGV